MKLIIDNFESIESIKFKIQDLTGIISDRINLLYKGNVLPDNECAIDLNFGCTLYLDVDLNKQSNTL